MESNFKILMIMRMILTKDFVKHLRIKSNAIIKHDVSATTCHLYQMQMKEAMNRYIYKNRRCETVLH